nr:MAG TPA: hypothetical protein [Caudoviricetes sp.]
MAHRYFFIGNVCSLKNNSYVCGAQNFKQLDSESVRCTAYGHF